MEGHVALRRELVGGVTGGSRLLPIPLPTDKTQSTASSQIVVNVPPGLVPLALTRVLGSWLGRLRTSPSSMRCGWPDYLCFAARQCTLAPWLAAVYIEAGVLVAMRVRVPVWRDAFVHRAVCTMAVIVEGCN